MNAFIDYIFIFRLALKTVHTKFKSKMSEILWSLADCEAICYMLYAFMAYD